MKAQLQTIREALERAQNGLKWYRDTYPDADSQADDEMDAEIEEAITALSELERMAGEPVAWCELTQSGEIAYFDGKPMVMIGPVGNEHHQHPLHAAPPAQQGAGPGGAKLGVKNETN